MISKSRITLLGVGAVGAIAAAAPAGASAANIAVCSQGYQPCSGTVGVSITQTQTQAPVTAKTEDVTVGGLMVYSNTNGGGGYYPPPPSVTVSPTASNGNQVQINKVTVVQASGVTVMSLPLHHH